jgi:hypothetical protein
MHTRLITIQCLGRLAFPNVRSGIEENAASEALFILAAWEVGHDLLFTADLETRPHGTEKSY